MDEAYKAAAKVAEQERDGLIAQRQKHEAKITEINHRLTQIEAVIQLAAGPDEKPKRDRKRPAKVEQASVQDSIGAMARSLTGDVISPGIKQIETLLNTEERRMSLQEIHTGLNKQFTQNYNKSTVQRWLQKGAELRMFRQEGKNKASTWGLAAWDGNGGNLPRLENVVHRVQP
jgi:hypothetical protein